MPNFRCTIICESYLKSNNLVIVNKMSQNNVRRDKSFPQLQTSKVKWGTLYVLKNHPKLPLVYACKVNVSGAIDHEWWNAA